MKILGIGGTLRKDSFSRVLLNYAQQTLQENAEMEIAAIADLPIFNQDKEQDLPELVSGFKQQIEKVDALLFVTAEYNHSIPGFFKNAIDWASRPYDDNSFKDKPGAVISSSTGMFGGVRAYMELRQVLDSLNVHLVNKPEVNVAKVAEKIVSGQLMDIKTKAKIDLLIKNLISWTKRIN
jgi:chromate reductase